MNIGNPWIGPLQRSYQQIRSKVLSSLGKLKDKDGNPLISDFTEGNILVLILSIFSGIAEMIHYYIDTLARETFFVTARKYTSLERHAALVDYYPKVATAAQCNMIFTRSLTENSSTVNISKGGSLDNLIDTQGNTWQLLSNVVMGSGVSQIKVPYIQRKLVSGALNGVVYQDTDGVYKSDVIAPSEGYLLHKGATSVSVGGESYTLVDTLAYSKPTDAHFILSSGETGVHLIFGDGTFGKHPAVNAVVTGDSYVTAGEAGNVEAAAITGGNGEVSYSNEIAGGGSNNESFKLLKQRVPLSVKTLGVAVTKQDYIDYALQIPDVAQAQLEYVCGRKLNVYISPVGGGTASDGLISQVKTELELHSPLNTWLNVLPVGTSAIILDMDVTGRPSYKKQDIYNNIITALSTAYPPDGPIGGKVRLSDIYALIDNLPSVDFLHINQFYVMPWPQLIYGNAQLNVSQFKINKASRVVKYIVEYQEGQLQVKAYQNITTFNSNQETSYEVFKGSLGSNIHVTYPEGMDFEIAFKSNGSIQEGYKYAFQVSNTNADYNKSGFNIPVFQEDSLTVNITEVV